MAMRDPRDGYGGQAQRGTTGLGLRLAGVDGVTPSFARTDGSGWEANTHRRASATEMSEPWDENSAEALTRLYETGAAGDQMPSIYFQDPPPRASERSTDMAPHADAPAVATPPRSQRPDPIAAPPLAAPLPVAPIMMQSMVPPPAATAPDQSGKVLETLAQNCDWLDERLADIAFRVEQSLAQIKPDASLSALNERFDHFEERVQTTLNGVARQSDLNGLRQIEAHIAELTQNFELTHSQLARLDGIEEQIRALTEFAQSQLDAPPAIDTAPAATGLDLPDFAALADEAATRTAERLAQMEPRGQRVDDGRADGVHSLLSDFIAERRREDGHTASMLDTMQEALVRLIDRVDQLEPGHAVQAAAATQPITAAVVATAPPASSQPHADGIVFVEDERGSNPGRRATDHEIAQAAAAQAHLAQKQAALANKAAPRDQQPAEVERRVADIPVTRDRRRHAVSAAADTDVEIPEAAPSVAASPPSAAAAPAARAQARPRIQTTVAEPEASKSGSGIAKKGLMVAGVAAMVVASAAFVMSFMGDKLRGQPVALPKLEERVPAPKSAAPRAGGPDFVEPLPAKPVTTPALQDGAPQPPKAQPASQRPSADAPAPSPLRQRSIPETVTDDLSSAQPQIDAAAVQSTVARVITGPSAAPTYGIALQQPGSGPSPLDLARQQPPRPSATTGAATVAAAVLAPTPQQAMRPQQPLTTASIKPMGGDMPADALVDGVSGGLAEMPPANIGPVSLRHAAQKGDPAAQFEIGARFAEGKGVKQDFKLAVDWYQRSAQQGFVPSQYRLGTLFERGLSGKADLERASLWYQRAAELGNVKAMHNLAVLGAGRDGTPADYKVAADWFTQAAERGLPDSQFNLAVLYENGLGVGQDQIQAYKWFAIAARSGDKEAVKRRDQLAARFQPDELRLAENAVTNWRSRPVDLKANDPRAAGDAWRAKMEQMAQANAPVLPAAAVPAPQAQAQPADTEAAKPKVRVHKGTPATPHVIKQ